LPGIVKSLQRRSIGPKRLKIEDERMDKSIGIEVVQQLYL
jgi:hypothetical protein